ncbi:MAG: hypothetical protein HQL97_01065 [Magnetococcales bacterium]|nr:hypothetical protein [Magnetococcales bacterium]
MKEIFREDLMTLTQVASEVKRAERTVSHWIQHGIGPDVIVMDGKYRLVSRKSFIEWFDRNQDRLSKGLAPT